MSENKIVVLDAVALFYLQIKNPPDVIKELRLHILNRKVIAVIPTIAVSEIIWKKRKEGKENLENLKTAYQKWKEASNIIIDSFDINILDKMVENNESYELHDEIIAMTCYKYNTKVIYSNDLEFKDFWNLEPIPW